MNPSVLFQLSYGLYVLTAKGGKDNGCIINTAMQITASPNRLLIAVNKNNLTHDIISYTKQFNLSILSQDCSFDTFKHFGYQSGKTVDKFANYENCQRSENGLLYLPRETNGYLSGKVTNIIDSGTHSLFIADVTAGEVLSEVPSVTYDYYQKSIKPAPSQGDAKSDSGKKRYRCRICDYIYEGESLPDDFICPICKHGVVDFEEI